MSIREVVNSFRLDKMRDHGGSSVKFYELTESGKKELSQKRHEQQAFDQALNALLGKP